MVAEMSLIKFDGLKTPRLVDHERTSIEGFTVYDSTTRLMLFYVFF